jgi:drug/metabolite transporter (DMT)-like permease
MPLVTPEPATSPKHLDPPPKRAWFFNPYLQIAISVLLNATAQIFIKIGTEQASNQSPLVLAYLTSGAMWLGCWLFLGEQISLLRWGGIFLVTFGVLLVAQPLSKIEERL